MATPKSIKTQMLGGLPFSVGQVIKCLHQFKQAKTPQSKFQIVVGIDKDELAIVFINSEISKKHSTPEAQALQISLYTPPNDFLSHVSFANCVELEIKKKHIFISEIKNDNKSDCFLLDSQDVAIILNKLKEADTISDEDKERFGFI